MRAAAADSALVLGDRAGWEACLAGLQSPGALGALARWAVAAGGGEAELARLVALLDTPALRADALWALGFSGRPEAAEACLAWLDDPVHGPRAGEAFSAITGLVLEGHYVRPAPPEQDALGPLEAEDLDADLVPPEEAALPHPSGVDVRDGWSLMRGRFPRGGRTLRGQPLTPEVLAAALLDEPLRRRAGLARETCVRTRGAWPVWERGWAWRQVREQPALPPERLRRAFTQLG